MKPSEIVKSIRKWDDKKMGLYEINGKLIKTNYGAYEYPYWDGNGADTNYKTIGIYQSSEDIFNNLVDAGYTYIRFVYTTTSIRGYHNLHVFYKKDYKDKSRTSTCKLDKNMKNYGEDRIYLCGSRRTICRNVYELNGKYYIRFSGQLVEVRKAYGYYRTVDAY